MFIFVSPNDVYKELMHVRLHSNDNMFSTLGKYVMASEFKLQLENHLTQALD